MDAAAAINTSPLLRRFTAALLIALGAFLILAIPQTSSVSTLFIELCALLAVALVLYGWLVYPLTTIIPACAALLVVLGWAWAVRRTDWLLASWVACAALTVLVISQRRRWARELQRHRQIVEQRQGQRTEAEHALASAADAQNALRKKLDRYSQLQTIAEELSNLTDLESIARLAVDRAFDLIGKSDVCLLFLLDPERQELSLFASRKQESVPAIRAKHGDPFDRHVMRTHRPLLVGEVHRDIRFTPAVIAERPVGSVIACPLLLNQRPEGVLRLDSAQTGAYLQDDLRFLDILLDLVGTAMTNARFFAQAQRLAMTDGLTGLTLRGPFLEGLSRELTHAAHSHEPVSVIMIDVDHFKAYNDTFGHTAGDLVLRLMADILRQTLPANALTARYGGEEFAVLLPRTSRLQAADLAEQLRSRIAQASPGESRKPLQPRTTPPRAGSVTVSVGIATAPEDAQAELDVIRVADQRLYSAKASGRNMVCAS